MKKIKGTGGDQDKGQSQGVTKMHLYMYDCYWSFRCKSYSVDVFTSYYYTVHNCQIKS